MHIDNLVNESYEYLLEFQQEMHELDMKMIKCEHHCIVNENYNLLEEAEDEYDNSFIDKIKKLWDKIVTFVQEFIIKIRKILMKLIERFKKLKNRLKNIVFKEAVEETKNIKEIRISHVAYGLIKDRIELPIEDWMNELKDGLANNSNRNAEYFKKSNEIILRSIKSLNRSAYDGYMTIDINKELVLNAEIMLNNYCPKWIKSLENANMYFKKESRKSFFKRNDYHCAIYCQKIVNTSIIEIQKFMSACIRICYAAEKM